MAPLEASALPRFKTHELEEIKTFTDLLHLIFHRNKNQHHLSIWWRGFSTFRREFQHFMTEYEASSTNKTSKKRAKARLQTWKQDMVPKWYLSFTHLISSTQFSAIGLVLLTILARVSLLTGIIAALEEEAEKEMQAMLHEFAQKDAHELFAATAADGAKKGEDLGEVIKRVREPEPELEREPHPEQEMEAEAAGREAVQPPAKKKKKELETKKKKKKGKSAIDDIFAGL